MKGFPTLKFTLPTLFVLLVYGALAWGLAEYQQVRRRSVLVNAGYSASREPEEILSDRPLGEQEQICQDLIRSLGGDEAILIAIESLPLACGTYPRPEGLEFFTEAGA